MDEEIHEENVTEIASTSAVCQKSLQRVDRRKASKRPSTDGDPRIGEALGILRTAVQRQTANDGADKDDCFIYGQHVANKLRKYSPRIRDIVQYHINTVLYHADMGNPDIEIRPSMYSQQLMVNASAPPPVYRHLQEENTTRFATPRSTSTYLTTPTPNNSAVASPIMPSDNYTITSMSPRTSLSSPADLTIPSSNPAVYSDEDVFTQLGTGTGV